MHFELKLRLPKIISKYLVVVALLVHFGPVSGQIQTLEGKLDDGTPYRIDRPRSGTELCLWLGLCWSGTLGWGDTGAANRYLVEHGFALAGTTRAVTGWAIQLAARNALQTLDIFTQKFGKPRYAVEFGGSMVGHTAAVICRHIRPNGTERHQVRRIIRNSRAVAREIRRSVGSESSPGPGIQSSRDPDSQGLSNYGVAGVATDVVTTTQTPQGKARAALAAIFAQMPRLVRSVKAACRQRRSGRPRRRPDSEPEDRSVATSDRGGSR